MRVLEAHWLGRVDYEAAWQLQQAAEAAVKAGTQSDQLLLLEHPPVITLGRAADRRHVLQPHVAVVETNRGGDVTWHGPGQLVGYPIMDLRPDRCDVGRYLRDLEAMLMDVLAGYGISAGRKSGLTGVWVGDEKVAALGVHMSRWVTTHGFALNVSPDLASFEAIVPCGIRDYGVTSMARLLGEAPTLESMLPRVIDCFGRVFDRSVRLTGSGAHAILAAGKEETA